jgi:hypothetical protein
MHGLESPCYHLQPLLAAASGKANQSPATREPEDLPRPVVIRNPMVKGSDRFAVRGMGILPMSFFARLRPGQDGRTHGWDEPMGETPMLRYAAGLSEPLFFCVLSCPFLGDAA